ncbi:acyl-CoA thioesterase/BAAT N-terminal domain-containing protein [Brevibacillus fluminis]|uniref:acyl-CoA thioesterase/BAAT N-terminal domain-containing protein n=1 Tax=Brevibacillus fluminis TaxID=511487 RepID=UPI003F88EF87
MRSPAITIFPNEAMIDEEVEITLSGFEPFQRITVRAKAKGMFGGEFEAESYAVFQADASGNISVANHAPLSGTYDTKDPMGLFWSMEVKKLRFPAKRTLSALPVFPSFGTVSFTAEVDGHVLAEAMLTRHYLSAGITYADVLDNGIVGRLLETGSVLSERGICG